MPNNSAVRFNAENHTYWYGNERWPGITEVLRSTGLLDEIDAALAGRGEILMARGRRVHEAIHAALEDDLDYSSLDDRERGMIAAALKAVKEMRLEIVAAETLVYHQALRYATMIDAVVKRDDGSLAIVNWKTPSHFAHYAIQSAGEALAFGAVAERWTIRLSPDGSYSLHAYKDRQDFRTFEAAALLYWWKRRNRKE